MALQTTPPVHRPLRLRRVILLASGTTLVLAGVTVAAVKLSTPAAPLKYLTAAVTRGNASLTDSATGEVTAAATNIVVLPQNAQITTLNVSLGQNVSAAQPLASFSDPALYTQLAEDSATVLTDQSQVTQDTSASYSAQQNAAISAAQDNLTAAEDTLAQDQANSQIRADSGGTVTWKVSAGAPVTAGQTVATIGTATVSAPMAGTLSGLSVGSGSPVSTGQLLATVSSPAASAKILSDQSQIAGLQSALYKAQAAVGQNSATVAEAKAQLQQNQQAYTAAKAAVAGLTVTAPYAGEITAINGSALPGGRVLTESSASMVAIISVPETQITQIHVGQSVQVSLPAMPGKNFTGTVSSIAPVGTYANGVSNFPVTVTVNNPAGIRYGMSAEVSVAVKTVKSSLLVPLAAIQSHGSHNFVEILAQNTPHRIPVRVTLENSTTAAVRSKHLTVGDHVVTAVLSSASGKLRLKPKGRALHHAKGGKTGRGKKAKA